VGRVVFEQIVFDEQNFGDVLRGEFVSEPGDAFADNESGDSTARVFRDVLRGSERFEAGAVPLILALLSYDEDFHGYITRASNFSFSTSFAAASFGVPDKNSVFFVFVGT